MAARASAGKTGEVVSARFFGHFKISVGARSIAETTTRARKPWSLLQYLMVHRHKNISNQQLMEALWPDGESDQPEKALKNLVYRVRTNFASLDVPFAQDIILYKNGAYRLNNDLPWDMDFEQFEALCKKAEDATRTAESRLADYRLAVALYEGDFLADHSLEDWVMSFNTYYRSLFFKCVQQMLDLLEKGEQYSEMELVSHRALSFDRFDEGLHKAYMKSLIAQNKRSAAISHYEATSDLFFRELGVSPDEELRNMYHDLARLTGRVQSDLAVIKEALREPEMRNDAFVCDLSVFREMYRLEARNAERVGQSVFIVLLTLDDDNAAHPSPQLMERGMDTLLDVIQSGLRRGDVASQLSPAQFIMMLPTITMENCERVISRLKDMFAAKCTRDGLRLSAHLQPLDPIF